MIRSRSSDNVSGPTDGHRKFVYSHLSLKCSDIGYPDCSHIAYGKTESALFRNAEYHAIHTHGYTKESWEKELLEKIEKFRSLMSMSTGID